MTISGPKESVAAFCRRHICRLAFFGPVLREDFRSDSDVDGRVEFEPGFAPSVRFFTMERELSNLNTPVSSANTSEKAYRPTGRPHTSRPDEEAVIVALEQDLRAADQ